MNDLLQADADGLAALLTQAQQAATDFLAGLPTRPAAVRPTDRPFRTLPEQGAGGPAALADFMRTYAAELSGSAGARYFGYVLGGATPAAVAGDWLVSAFDQNLAATGDSVATHVERETLALLQQLLGLPTDFAGCFVTGATMANFVGLALARQWAGHRRGVDVAQAGSQGLGPLPVLSAAPHSSVYKSLAMLGLGRDSIQLVPSLPGGREALDVAALEAALEQLAGQPAVVVASAGTVNTVDFDDLQALGALKQRYPFWLHVDAAFGGFAACSPTYAPLLRGIGHADSVAVDAHKWLNVPYDAAMLYTRPEHRALQVAVFQNSASYLPAATLDAPDFHHLTPENSRRFRALPAWCTLLAYGRAGYRELVERNCRLARQLSQYLADSPQFALLAPTRLNVVCFTLRGPGAEDPTALARLQRWLRDDGRAFFTPTVLHGRPGLRAAFANWRTEDADVALAWQALQEGAARVLATTDL
ncbi:pyridoxal phosphate-dependent decarboxylase family protein [Hymenobacter daeguensis]